MAKIVIVEDEQTIREELASLLTQTGYSVSYLTEFQHATEDILERNPDLILMDVNLPGTNGLILCDQIRKKSQVPIIFVTSNNTSMDELNCIMRGGDDYVAKPYQIPILLARIAAVLKRSMRKEEGDMSCQHKGVTLYPLAAQLQYQDKRIDLTRNELKILGILFEHKGEFVSRTTLMDILWDQEIYIDDNTLSVNVTRIRGKLQEIGMEDFIESKRGLGYRI